MNKEELDREIENLEHNHTFEKYQKSGSKDDFQTWKMKKYVDDKFTSLYINVVILIIVFVIAVHFKII